MNKILPFIFILLLPLFCKAQPWTINQGKHRQVYLFNPSTGEYKTIGLHVKGKFVGIDYVNEKTCIAYFVKKGDSIRKSVTLPYIVHKKESDFEIIHKDSTSYTYSVKHSDIEINSDYNIGILKIFQDQKLVLEYKPLPTKSYVQHKFYKQMLPEFIISIPKDIDLNKQTLLILQKHLPNEYGNTSRGLASEISEISLLDGAILFSKKNVQNPSYSPDKKFILFFNLDRDLAYYLDRQTNVIRYDKKSLAAFWL